MIPVHQEYATRCRESFHFRPLWQACRSRRAVDVRRRHRELFLCASSRAVPAPRAAPSGTVLFVIRVLYRARWKTSGGRAGFTFFRERSESTLARPSRRRRRRRCSLNARHHARFILPPCKRGEKNALFPTVIKDLRNFQMVLSFFFV